MDWIRNVAHDGSLPSVDLELTRSYAKEDISAYANLIHSPGQIHVDSEHCRSLGYPDVLAHGMFMFNGVEEIVQEITGDPLWHTKARIRCRFRQPVFAGDSVTTTAALRGDPQQEGAASIETTSVNQDGDVVIQGWIDFPLPEPK